MKKSTPDALEPGAPDARSPSRTNGGAPAIFNGGQALQRAGRSDRLLDSHRLMVVRFTTDAAMLMLGAVLGSLVAGSDAIAPLLALYPPLALSLLYARGRYRIRLGDAVLDSIAPGFGAISIAAMTVFVGSSIVYGSRSVDGSVVMATWLSSLVTVTAAGSLLATIQYQARKRRRIHSPTLIIGTDRAGLNIAKRLTRQPEYGLRPVGFLDNRSDELWTGGLAVLGELSDLPEVATSLGVGNVVLAFPAAGDDELLALIKVCDEMDLATIVLPRLSGTINHRTQYDHLGTVPVLNLRAIEPDGWRFELKHLFDRVGALLLLLSLLPLLTLVAVAVKLSSPGPVLFRQRRMSRGGEPFELLKFRTMTNGPDAAEAVTLSPGLAPGGVEGVDRRTRVGRLLRRTSVDELPQLLNVIRGEMSLVGPRPERPEFAEQFREDLERYVDRHRVKPGMTGWAQVNGFRGQTPLAERIEFDNFYIEHWSLALDAKIMILTIPALLKGS